MSNVTIKLKNGATKEFIEKGRPGGSYHVSIKYEGGMAIVTDEYYNMTAYPIEDIEEVTTRSNERGGW